MLLTSNKFQIPVKKINPSYFNGTPDKDHEKMVHCALKKVTKIIYDCELEFNIVPSVKEELIFFAQHLELKYGVSWGYPIAFLTPRMPPASTYGDSCLESRGGYSIKVSL